ncbi:hypothetical protein PFISCL1PPCAC_706, partial [Pristionchus fissidentatus]
SDGGRVVVGWMGAVGRRPRCWSCEESRMERESGEEEARNASTDGAVAIRSAGGVFKQINNVGKPFYTHVSGGTLGWRQINTIGKKAIYKPTTWGSYMSALGTRDLPAPPSSHSFQLLEHLQEESREVSSERRMGRGAQRLLRMLCFPPLRRDAISNIHHPFPFEMLSKHNILNTQITFYFSEVLSKMQYINHPNNFPFPV